MKSIRNKTRLPLRITLPGGKLLHLGPGKTGQVTDQATDLPSFRKLVADGKIELLGEGGGGGEEREEGSPVHESTHGHQQPRVVTPKGNR